MLSQERIKVLKKEVKALFRGSKKSNQRIMDYFRQLPEDATIGNWNSCRHCPMSEFIYSNTSAREMDFLMNENEIVIDAYGADVKIKLPLIGQVISEDNGFNEAFLEHSPVEASYIKYLIAEYPMK